MCMFLCDFTWSLGPVMIHRKDLFFVHNSPNLFESPRLAMTIPPNVQNLATEVLSPAQGASIVRVTTEHPSTMRHFVPHVNGIVLQNRVLTIDNCLKVVTQIQHVFILKWIDFHLKWPNMTLTYSLVKGLHGL